METGGRLVRSKLVLFGVAVLVMLIGGLAAHYLGNASAEPRPNAATATLAPSIGVASKLSGLEQHGLNAYAVAVERQIAQADRRRYAVPPAADVPPLNAAEADMIAHTTQLYYDRFGRGTFDSFIGAGIETGNPIPKNLGRQWNSLKDSGLYVPAFRHAFIGKMKALGIRNVRLGLSNHEVFKTSRSTDGPWDDASWRQMDDIISDLAAGGLKLSLDLHHFGIERMFLTAAQPGDPSTDLVRDGVNYSRSFYLSPNWPAYFADFAGEAFRRYHDKVVAFTLINEPETTNGFQSQMWNGGQPGWFSPEHTKLYIERGIQVGLAAIGARTRMEELNTALPAGERKPLLFIQSEAAQYKADDAQFTAYTRFMTLDMILGQRWLLQADLKSLELDSLDDLEARWTARSKAPKSMLEWLIHRYVFQYSKEDREQRRNYLLVRLETLQRAHRAFAMRFGITMQSSTVLGIDYYAQNESRSAATKVREQLGTENTLRATDANTQQMDSEPSNYGAQLHSGERVGLYGVALAYWGRYRTMPLASTENGTAWSDEMFEWHAQQLLEESLIQQRHHIPFIGHFLYPLIDVRGWEDNRALSLEPVDDGYFGATGLIDHDLVSRPSFEPMLRELRTTWTTGAETQ